MRWWHVRRMMIAALVLLVLIAVPVASQLASSNTAALRARAAAGSSQVCAWDDREPDSDGARLKGESIRDGARKMLVPLGATGLTICLYNSAIPTSRTPQFGLAGIGVIDNATVLAKLTRELDAIKPTRPGAVYNCPADIGSEAILAFGYNSPPGVTVRVGLSGCESVSNDAGFTRLALDAPAVGQVEALSAPVDHGWPALSGAVRLRVPVGQAQAINSSGFPVAMTQVVHHRFHFRIATDGRYTIVLTGTGRTTNRIVAKLSALVTGSATTHVTITSADLLN